jgi:NAD dependent epimerase/dehydratase family enzyme
MEQPVESSFGMEQDPIRLRPLRIVLPGGSGQVGEMLARYFQERGHRVTVLTRSPYAANWQTVHWDGENPGPWVETLEGADVCINLTGRSINCRPTMANRREIYTSRIGSTQLLHRVVASMANPPKLWMNASAATLYKRAVDERGVDLPLDEASPVEGGDVVGELLPGAESWSHPRGFMARVVRDWEAAFFGAETPRTRKVALRSAVTFSPAPGNVFALLSNLVRLSLGGTQGSGRQFLPWIHEADYARAVEFLIAREELDGPFNLAAPNPARNREFMEALREALDVPNGIPAPSLAIRLGALLMGTNPELVLGSCRAVPGRLLDAGFEFLFPEWPEAADDLARRWKADRN